MGVDTKAIIPAFQDMTEVADTLNNLNFENGIKIKVGDIPDTSLEEYELNGKYYKNSFNVLKLTVTYPDGSESLRRLSVFGYPEATTDKEYYGENLGDYGYLTTNPRVTLSLSNNEEAINILETYAKATGGWFIANDCLDEEPVSYPLTDKLDNDTRVEFYTNQFSNDLKSLIEKHTGKPLDITDTKDDMVKNFHLTVGLFEDEKIKDLEKSDTVSIKKINIPSI